MKTLTSLAKQKCTHKQPSPSKASNSIWLASRLARKQRRRTEQSEEGADSRVFMKSGMNEWSEVVRSELRRGLRGLSTHLNLLGWTSDPWNSRKHETTDAPNEKHASVFCGATPGTQSESFNWPSIRNSMLFIQAGCFVPRVCVQHIDRGRLVYRWVSYSTRSQNNFMKRNSYWSEQQAAIWYQ